MQKFYGLLAAVFLAGCDDPQTQKYQPLVVLKSEDITNQVGQPIPRGELFVQPQVWGTVYSLGIISPTGAVELSKLAVVHGSNTLPVRFVTHLVTQTNTVTLTNDMRPEAPR